MQTHARLLPLVRRQSTLQCRGALLLKTRLLLAILQRWCIMWHAAATVAHQVLQRQAIRLLLGTVLPNCAAAGAAAAVL